MGEDVVMGVGADAIRTIVLIAGPMLVAAMAVGVVVSVLQAVTQINEQTLSFIPKMIAVILVLAVMAPWMLEILKDYTIETITSAADVRR